MAASAAAGGGGYMSILVHMVMGDTGLNPSPKEAGGALLGDILFVLGDDDDCSISSSRVGVITTAA